ncbi:MAG: hypothetical protein M9962_06820 [Oligoflexia bacterium]|nr:hypothetical protein [Oligoflexia bacterium]
MSEKVFQAGITRESGYLYFLDKKGFICKVKMARGHGGSKPSPARIMQTNIIRQPGFLYYVDKGGDVSMVKMSRSGRKKQSVNKKVARKKTLIESNP